MRLPAPAAQTRSHPRRAKRKPARRPPRGAGVASRGARYVSAAGSIIAIRGRQRSIPSVLARAEETKGASLRCTDPAERSELARPTWLARPAGHRLAVL